MRHNTRKRHPIMMTYEESRPEPIIDEASSTVTYIGYADLGTRQDEPYWQIKRVTTTGSVTITEYADGDMEYDNIWNNRTSLRYNR